MKFKESARALFGAAAVYAAMAACGGASGPPGTSLGDPVSSAEAAPPAPAPALDVAVEQCTEKWFDGKSTRLVAIHAYVGKRLVDVAGVSAVGHLRPALIEQYPPAVVPGFADQQAQALLSEGPAQAKAAVDCGEEAAPRFDRVSFVLRGP